MKKRQSECSVFRAVKAAGSISYQHNGNRIETVKYSIRTRGLALQEVGTNATQSTDSLTKPKVTGDMATINYMTHKHRTKKLTHLFGVFKLDSIVGIMTRYGPDGPEIEPRYR
jgi:hypothetical protein